MLLGLAILFGSITAILYSLHYSTRGGRRGNLIDKIPGPYAWPMIGNIGQFMVPLDEMWNVMRHLNNDYPGIYRFWSGMIPVVHLSNPDDVQVLLTSSTHIEKSIFYKFLHPWLGTGLLTSGGKKWHQRRKILTPAFHFGVLRQFVGIFIEQSDRLVESLCPDGEEVVDDLVSLLHNYTLNSICGEYKYYFKTANTSLFCVDHIPFGGGIDRVTRPWLYVDCFFRWSKRFVDQCRALGVLHGFSTNLIKERRQYHEETDGQYLKGLGNNGGIYGHDDHHVSGKRRLAMLDLLISFAQRGAGIDDDGIREEVDTFVFEGHDTIAMSLCFALLLLAENKEIQDKARAEVDEVFGELEEDKFSMREIQRLGYLERCIKESLRLFPGVPLFARHISEDLQLKNYLLPGGTNVHIHVYELHRNPNFWPNPTVFDPDRFLPERVQGRHPFAYVPFSAGPRNCIGQKFAMLESKALVGNLLHKFYLEPIDLSSEVRITMDFVLRPLNPVRIRLVRRSSN